jgi:hypothetical protein
LVGHQEPGLENSNPGNGIAMPAVSAGSLFVRTEMNLVRIGTASD